MKDYIRAIDDLPTFLKLILALPGIDGIVYGLYRIFKGAVKDDMVMVVVGIIWIFVGATVFWIIDIISVLLYGKVVLFAN